MSSRVTYNAETGIKATLGEDHSQYLRAQLRDWPAYGPSVGFSVGQRGLDTFQGIDRNVVLQGRDGVRMFGEYMARLTAATDFEYDHLPQEYIVIETDRSEDDRVASFVAAYDMNALIERDNAVTANPAEFMQGGVFDAIREAKEGSEEIAGYSPEFNATSGVLGKALDNALSLLAEVEKSRVIDGADSVPDGYDTVLRVTQKYDSLTLNFRMAHPIPLVNAVQLTKWIEENLSSLKKRKSVLG